MTLGPGKIIGTFFAVAAIIVAFSAVARLQVAMRMQRTVGVWSYDSNGRKAVDYSIGRIGTSSGQSVNVKVRYNYTVNGNNYEGTILRMNGNSYSGFSEEKVKSIIAELTKTYDIPVWYDSKHPEFAVIIEPHVGEDAWWLISLSLLAFLNFRYLDGVVVKLQRKSKANSC